MSITAVTGARVLTPEGWRDGVLIEGTRIIATFDGAAPASDSRLRLNGGVLLPGFIDTQVNGGGGVLFNDAPTVDGIRTIGAAHRRHGTTGLLPTLISDDLDVIARAIEAVDTAIDEGVPGVLGIHIEGPFLNPDKRGIHDAGKFRPLDDEAMALLTQPGRGVRMVTLAPECAPPGAIRTLADAGVIVSAGHSMATYEQARAALDEGLAGFTHLFNAMTGLESRAPGMVGAALEDRASRFGIIVDGQHVAPATLRVALAARGLDGAMLVTDAMPPAGTDLTDFMLMGRTITVADGALRGAGGTLAGAALTMAQAFRNAVAMLNLAPEQASQLASGNPAAFLRLEQQTGVIAPGLRADLVHLDDDHRVTRTWIGGVLQEVGE
jgi:N-acetylglucosamine-6-phosphate deacetylase